jgi:hypothetical protein
MKAVIFYIFGILIWALAVLIWVLVPMGCTSVPKPDRREVPEIPYVFSCESRIQGGHKVYICP